jgi:hypothetical protein
MSPNPAGNGNVEKLFYGDTHLLAKRKSLMIFASKLGLGQDTYALCRLL